MHPKHKILVVDDDHTTLAMVTEVLETEGFDVVTASDGVRALECVMAAPFDAIVLDIMMPGSDGISTLRRIRQRREAAHTPVIMLTALADHENTWEAWRAGCDYYVTKPFDPRDLVGALDRLLGRSRRAFPA